MQLMFCSTFFAMTLSCSERLVHILTLSIIEQRPHKHLMKIKRQNIYEATILGETEMGFSRKKTNRGGGGTFLKNPLDFLGLSFYLWKFWIKQSITPENLAKLCYTPWKFQDHKRRPLEIQHDFFLITPGDSTSFLIDP